MASLVLAVRFLTIVPVPGREAAGPGALGRRRLVVPRYRARARRRAACWPIACWPRLVPRARVGRTGRGGLEGVHGRPSSRRARRLPRWAGRRECGAQAGHHARQPHRGLRRARARPVPLDCLRGRVGHPADAWAPILLLAPAVGRLTSLLVGPRVRPATPGQGLGAAFLAGLPRAAGPSGSPSCSSSPGSCSSRGDRRWRLSRLVAEGWESEAFSRARRRLPHTLPRSAWEGS